MLRRVGPRDASVLENHRHTIGGTGGRTSACDGTG
jgi:hypothetical protein